MPGIYSARFAGKTCNSNDNIEKVWKLLIGYKNTDAKFKSILSLNIDGKTFFFEGKINGKIIFKQEISNGNYKIPKKLKSGVYFARLKFEDKIEIQKLVKH